MPNRTDDLAALSEKATPGPWAYRPDKFDDWGFVRSRDGKIACIAHGDDHRTHDAHRAAKTDPREPNGRFIVALVNAYRDGSLILSPSSVAPTAGTVERQDCECPACTTHGRSPNAECGYCGGSGTVPESAALPAEASLRPTENAGEIETVTLQQAKAIADSDHVMRVYAAPEFDELSDDGKSWVKAIVEAARNAGRPAEVGGAPVIQFARNAVAAMPAMCHPRNAADMRAGKYYTSMCSDRWQPIATAPKDRDILLWPCLTKDGSVVTKGRWYRHPSVEGWITYEIDCGDYDFSPTRWTDLPAPPTEPAPAGTSEVGGAP